MKYTFKYPKTHFSPQLVQKVGGIGEVLENFLKTQVEVIQLGLVSKYPNADERAVQHLLNEFITVDGTKKPKEKGQIDLRNLPQPHLDFCLQELEKARVLRQDDDQYELAHDTLALTIANERTAEDVAMLKIQSLVADRLNNYTTNKTYLSKNELRLIATYEKQLISEGRLSDPEQGFIRRSVKFHGRLKRNRYLLLFAIFVGLVVAALLINWQRIKAVEAREKAQIEEQKAIEAKEEADSLSNSLTQTLHALTESNKEYAEELYARLLDEGEELQIKEEFKAAEEKFAEALRLVNEDFKEFRIDNFGQTAEALLGGVDNAVVSSDQYKKYIEEGDAFKDRKRWLSARNRYQKALETDYNNSKAKAKLEALSAPIEAEYNKYMKAGQENFKIKKYDIAKEKFSTAAKFKKTNEVKRMIRECRKQLSYAD